MKPSSDYRRAPVPASLNRLKISESPQKQNVEPSSQAQSNWQRGWFHDSLKAPKGKGWQRRCLRDRFESRLLGVQLDCKTKQSAKECPAEMDVLKQSSERLKSEAQSTVRL